MANIMARSKAGKDGASRRITLNWAVTAAFSAALITWLISQNFAAAGLAGIIAAMGCGLNVDNVVFQAPLVGKLPRWARGLYFSAGVLISTLGVQLVVPVYIVSLVNGLGFLDTARLAVFHGAEFGHLEEHATPFIATGAAAFLGLMFLNFMLDPTKKLHWLHWIEKPLARMGGKDNLSYGLGGIALILLCLFAPTTHRDWMWAICFVCMVAFFFFHMAGSSMEAEGGSHDKEAESVPWYRILGRLGFIMLLGAIFSIDSLASAFAITSQIVAIVVGLVVSDLFMRVLIMHVSESNFLEKYRYLKISAYWAIGWLFLMTYLTAWGIEVPEILVGGGGTAVILAGLIHSHLENRRRAANNAAS